MSERATTQRSQLFQPESNQVSGILQRKCASCGNHTVAGGECAECAKYKSGFQRKLAIGASHDPLEQEADRVADEVLATPAHSAMSGTPPRIQRFAGYSAGEVATAPASVDRVLASAGRPIEPVLRQDMEQRFGHDFSRVRVHSGAAAEQSARDVNAHAYTVGHNVVFGAGRFAPGTDDGKRLLAHELTHVVQQSGSDESHVGQGNEKRGLSRTAIHPMIQRDLAIKPPRPDTVGRVLTPAQMADAITFNNRVLGSIANSADIIRLIRDVIGVSPLPAVVDDDFVNGVVQWQANFGLGQDGRLGPTTARPLFREIGAEGVGRGELRRNPRYAPAGPINVARAGARVAHFDMSAEFKSDPANGVFPSCGEIRQDIQWDAAFVAASVAAGNGSVPHVGFPAAHPANTWIEDRNATDSLRYGHRAAFDRGLGNRYLDTAGQANQAFGHIYRGEDNPQGLPADRGSWRFRLRAIDVCNGNQQLAVSPTLVMNWL